MIGARCADLIAEAVTAMEFKASAEDISRMSHAHPICGSNKRSSFSSN
jgi:dihydrolipoamide dehydrogenase